MQIYKAASKHDFEAIGNIYASSWKIAYKGIVPQSSLDALHGTRWSEGLAEGPYDSYIITDGKKNAGAASVSFSHEIKMTGWGEICGIYLLPEYFGKGYGLPLFEYAINALLSKKVKDIYLWVFAENIRAQKFYKKHGFQKSDASEVITIGQKNLTEIRYIRHF